jgi:MerR family transcriptional regulator, light-induced transcriptional regulator
MKKQPNSPQRDASPAEEFFPIRTVAALTGVNAITLRAWERRYGVIEPERTATGHRLYRREQIELIHRVVALLEKGIRISQVRQALGRPSEESESEADSVWTHARKNMISAITRFDEAALEDTYNDLLALHPIAAVTDRLLVPLLTEVGQRWATAEGSVAEEHFFSVYLRHKLGARFHHRARLTAGQRILCACLPGEHHETGLLLFALAAHSRGYDAVLLGANMPLAELPIAAKRSRCEALVVAGSIDAPATLWARELPQLVASARVPVCVGGAASETHHAEILRARAHSLGTDIPQGIRRLGEVIKDFSGSS